MYTLRIKPITLPLTAPCSPVKSYPSLYFSCRICCFTQMREVKMFPVDFKYVQRDSAFASVCLHTDVSGQKYVFVHSIMLGCSSNLMSNLHKSSKVLLKHSLHRMFNASQRWHKCIYTLHML